LLEQDPWELTALLGDVVPQPRVLLLAHEQGFPRGEPIFACSDVVLRHSSRLLRQRSAVTAIPSATIANATGTSTGRCSGRSFCASTRAATRDIQVMLMTPSATTTVRVACGAPANDDGRPRARAQTSTRGCRPTPPTTRSATG